MLSSTLAGLPPWRRFSTPAYYVANAGSDSNSGLSPLLPFLTVAHALAVIGSVPSVLSLHSGDSFAEVVSIPATVRVTLYGGALYALIDGVPYDVNGLITDNITMAVPLLGMFAG